MMLIIERMKFMSNMDLVRNIDGVWKLEGFVTQKNAEASIKIGFIGIGQGGSKKVDAFAGIRSAKTGEPVYKCMIVNSNLGDMRSLKNIPAHLQFGLEGYEKGVGKNPEVGKEAFMTNGSKIFSAIGQEMRDCEFIYVCAALGGGTGTGSINVLVDAIADYLHIPVAVIASLPRPDEVESLNAYNAMVELVPKLRDVRQDDERTYRGLENLVLLDNEKIVQEHTANPPELKNITWDYYSNYKVASIIHEWNVLTSLDSAITLDAADLSNHVLKTGGVLTFAKKKINLDEMKSKEELIGQIIETYKGKNVLANGFDYESDMQSMALVVVMPKDRMDMLNQDTLEIIRTRLKQVLPNVSIYPGFASHSSSHNAIVYTMASMAGLPERARNLREEAETLQRNRELREQQSSGFSMGDKIAVNKPVVTQRKMSGNPFEMPAQKQTAAGKVPGPFDKPKTSSPFDFKR